MTADYRFKAPPGWLVPSYGWTPPKGWNPDPAWPPAPADWEFWAIVPDPVPNAPEATLTPVSPEPRPEVVPPAATTSGEGGPVADAEARCRALQTRVTELQAEVERLAASAETQDDVDLSDERVLQEVGIYRYHHPLENAAEYKEELAALSDQVKEMVKLGKAVLVSNMFTFNNSLAKGRKMTGEFSKLMLRAYNAEADNCVRTLRAGNVTTAKNRLDASVTAIARLGSMMEMRINPEYHQLRFLELELTADFLMKVQVEKEEAREERDRLREERRAEQELAAERERLTKEHDHYVNALNALQRAGDAIAIAELTQKLASIVQAIEHNDFRLANIRAGYVYVISNTGAFGPNVVKIGLTRRLKPMERVHELGSASVPFPFDVHALFFSADAVTVEADLHRAFSSRRVNRVNQRREFFFATPAEVRTVLLEQVGDLLQFTQEPEATQYLQSRGYWREALPAQPGVPNEHATVSPRESS
jgi:uncharacterized protein YlxW (UPF0749 family)